MGKTQSLFLWSLPFSRERDINQINESSICTQVVSTGAEDKAGKEDGESQSSVDGGPGLASEKVTFRQRVLMLIFAF